MSSKVGVGVSSSVIVNSGDTTAELANNTQLVDAGAVDITADGTQSIDVIGISAAAASSAGIAGVSTVLVSENAVEALIGTGVQIVASGDVSLTANNDFETLSVAGGLGVGGSAGIGAAASVVTVENVTRAVIANGTSATDAVKISQAGVLNIDANASQAGKTFAVAGGVATESAGVGAGEGVFVLDTTTEALLGDYAYIHSTRKATQTGSKPPRIDVRHRSLAGCDVDVLRAIGPHLRRILVNFRVFTDLGCSRDVVQLDCHHPTNTRI